jgi:hypothetical protein
MQALNPPQFQILEHPEHQITDGRAADVCLCRPKYESCGPDWDCGGKRSTAALGPLADMYAKSDADPKLPKGIVQARKTYPQYDFKAGHMLNARFGGDGKDASNLVILTARANVSCNRFDGDGGIGKALNALGRLYALLVSYYVDINKRSGEGRTLLQYGIKVEITVSPERWGNDEKKLEYNIHNWLFMRAEVWKTLETYRETFNDRDYAVVLFEGEPLMDSNDDAVILTESQVIAVNHEIEHFEDAVASVAYVEVDNRPYKE